MKLILIILILIITILIISMYILEHCRDNNCSNNYALNLLSPIILGGTTLYDINIDNRKRIFIPDNEKLVVDGHNIIHDITRGEKLKEEIFNSTVIEVSKILLEAFPTQDIHFVIKNSDNKKNNKKNNKNKKSYVEKVVEFSKNIPQITFHLAYKKESKKEEFHYMKARDDYLTIYLAKGAYIISRDKYRDFKHFKKIEPFYHYSIKNGNIFLTESMNPEISYKKLERPNLGNHFIYSIVDNETLNNMKITNGSIYLEDDSNLAKIYLSRNLK